VTATTATTTVTTVTAKVLSVYAELAIVVVPPAVSVPPTIVVAAAAGRVRRIIAVHRRRRPVARSRVVALFSYVDKLPVASRVVCRPALKILHDIIVEYYYYDWFSTRLRVGT